ncbi:hypothetical protein ACFSQQ_08450 [Mesorhizobium kowhaii]|uniref:Uncharacterized protein n=1 Tax=Mesorhizobium kowhaii TaxID=1300272 RepID=A0A2W7BRS2_9HYPH|nr:hypothetical protein [Mesorhizobium kowhaii]PZV33304.1 hypothetical protein B5V02_38935 [Mesorhizobium kowhaii]
MAHDHADHRKNTLLIFDHCQQFTADILRALRDRPRREALKVSERHCALIFGREHHHLLLHRCDHLVQADDLHRSREQCDDRSPHHLVKHDPIARLSAN